jgi:hypothetical protein
MVEFFTVTEAPATGPVSSSTLPEIVLSCAEIMAGSNNRRRTTVLLNNRFISKSKFSSQLKLKAVSNLARLIISSYIAHTSKLHQQSIGSWFAIDLNYINSTSL